MPAGYIKSEKATLRINAQEVDDGTVRKLHL